MSYQQLSIFVEGEDDKRFFDSIIVPQLTYDWIEVIKYARKTDEWINKYIGTLLKLRRDYLYIIDIDTTPCISKKKEIITTKIKNIDIDKIIVVNKEIESWYFAGLSDLDFKQLGVNDSGKFNTTDNLTKEKFNQSIPDRFLDSRIDFMKEILKYYNLRIVRENQTNQSLNYFINHYLI